MPHLSPKELVSISELETILGTTLSARDNFIDEFSTGYVVRDGKIRILILHQLETPQIPAEISYLKHLEGLFLLENGITHLPNSLGELGKLRELYLSNNNISVIPKSVGNLSELKVLNLSNNKIQQLPEEISRLLNLRELYLSGNLLVELSPSIAKLPRLRELSVVRNPQLNIPVEIKEMKLDYLGVD